jgi:RNA polymerase sigma factor (sigma-70 family)
VLTPSAVAPEGDEELLRSLGEGEPQAVELLYQRYGSKMLAFARRYVADEGSAEDVVIELLRSWLERPPIVREFERLSAFLATSVYHACVDWIRRDRAEQGHPPRPTHPPPSRERERVGVGSREVLAARLATALGQLASPDRLLLETHYGQALTSEECMTLLGISRAAFHQRLHRARTRLARLLATDDIAADEGKQDA